MSGPESLNEIDHDIIVALFSSVVSTQRAIWPISSFNRINRFVVNLKFKIAHVLVSSVKVEYLLPNSMKDYSDSNSGWLSQPYGEFEVLPNIGWHHLRVKLLPTR